ncbi:MAG TPA: hypothetical protein VF796_08620 [Humisphaera sp.]
MAIQPPRPSNVSPPGFHAAPEPVPAPPPADGTADPQPGFLDTPWVQNVLPFVTSVAAHAGLALLAVVLAMVAKQAAKTVATKDAAEDQVVTSCGTIVDAPSSGVIPDLRSNDRQPPARQDQDDTVVSAGIASKAGPAVDLRAMGGGNGGDATGDNNLFAGTGGKGERGLRGVGTGGGPGDGDANGPLIGFGPPGGSGRGPVNPIFGPSGGNARKIVFVCDATGTMIQKLSVLRRELKASIKDLRNGVQSYKVVWYTDGGKVLTERGPGKDGMIVCSGVNKDATFTWLDDIVPAGTTDPIPAIEAAFALKPDLIYFLSDGEFNNLRTYQEVLDAVVKGSQSSKGTKVNTILFDTIDPEAKKVMEDMSRQTSGRYREVRISDLEGN